MKKTILISVLLIILAILGVRIFIFIEHKQEQAGLEKFHKLTSEDPLFYSSFFDPKAWERAIKILGDSEDKLKKTSIETYPKAFPNATTAEKNDYILTMQEDNLFPYQFLKDLSYVNQKTNEFLKKPSQKLGKELLTLYDKATDSYTKDVDSKIKALEKLDKKEKIMKEYLIFPDNISSFEILKNDFLTIRENANKLKEEVKKRRKCLAGKGPCLKALEDSQKIDSFVDSLNAKFDLTGENIDFIKNEFESIRPPIAFMPISGPYKIRSLCWQSQNYEQWLYITFRKNTNEDPSAVFKLANQNYYQKIPENSNSKINKALLKKGFNFFYQSEAATYDCLDSTFQPQLLTINFLKKQIGDKQIAKEDLIKNKDYKTLIENLFGTMTPAMNEVAGTIMGTLEPRVIIAELPLSQKYLLAVRSVYSIFSFPFAKSIWRTDKKLQYFALEKDLPAITSKRFFTIDDLKKLGYSEKEIRGFNPGRETAFFESILKEKE